ncbi:riboflavin kinase [Peribacillus glennii]|uniref:riboflavin kinase n=1 Tax=Peribacillus glennii TaxID=2303991 RepID=A0A372LFQ9_9BACI|nr:riboflavin kinase [Peribacillus glennii]RFU65133.1 riboflavin kinase [Peribacillus glennii]
MKSKTILEIIFTVEGKVINGEGRGSNIGFPTANIDISSQYLESGVYGVRVDIKGSRYFGVMNIGKKPTFHKDYQKNIEIHIFDFNESIYGTSIYAEALFKIRDEQKFLSVDELKSQINKDIATATSIFKSITQIRGENNVSFR